MNILRITQISRYNPLCSVGKVGDTEVSKTVCSLRSAFTHRMLTLEQVYHKRVFSARGRCRSACSDRCVETGRGTARLLRAAEAGGFRLARFL